MTHEILEVRFVQGLLAVGATAVSVLVLQIALAIATKLREFSPYAAMELILPGGSLMALMLWLYRRKKRPSFFQAVF